MKHEIFTILIVEDSRTQSAYLQSILESENYKTRIALNGAEALALISEKKPELVLTDVIMPVMDGFALCKNIKKEQSLSDIPVILLTSLTNPNKLDQVLNNLLTNAVKFSNPGTTIQVTIEDRSNELYFCVEDQGQGIPQWSTKYCSNHLGKPRSKPPRESPAPDWGCSV